MVTASFFIRLMCFHLARLFPFHLGADLPVPRSPNSTACASSPSVHRAVTTPDPILQPHERVHGHRCVLSGARSSCLPAATALLATAPLAPASSLLPPRLLEPHKARRQCAAGLESRASLSWPFEATVVG